MDAPTTYDAYLEVEQSGRWVARILDLTGCCAYGASESEALAALNAAIPGYFAWLKRHDDYTPDMHGPFQVVPRATFRTTMTGDYEANAFFPVDDQPMDNEELDWGLALLGWAAEDLVALMRAQPPGALEHRPAAGGWSVGEIVAHLARAQLWYVTRLDDPPIPPPVELGPGDPVAQLLTVTSACAARLRAASNDERTTLHILRGEQWSLRKIVRRSVEHALEHTTQVRALLA